MQGRGVNHRFAGELLYLVFGNFKREPELLRSNTEAAAAAGVFGVPAMVVDDKLFWGLDSLPMLSAYLAGDAWFEQEWAQSGSRPSGL